MTKLGTISLLVIIPLMWSCGPSRSFSYGMTTIVMPDGTKVYFKREVGWLDHDLWVVSPSNDLCHMPNPDTDYRFRQMGPIDPFYKVEGNSLLLFIRGSAAESPKSGSFPINIIQKEVDPLDYLQLKKDPGKLGLKELDVRIDENLKCGA